MARLNVVSALIRALIVAVVFGVFIGAIYAFVLPAAFPGYATPWILRAGAVLAMLVGGSIGFRVPKVEPLPLKIGVGFGFAVVVAILVYFISFAIIVVVRGD